MLPFEKMPNGWALEDLNTLCRERFAENHRVDFKQSLSLETNESKRELLKDFSSLANASGGVIIYGIREEKDPALGSVAAGLTPLNEPGLLDRANRILSARVHPSFQYFIYQIPDTTEGYYLIAYVPQSWQRPHAFQIKSRLEWYIRRNADNIPMTEPEIRSLYQASAAVHQTMKQRYSALDLDVGTPIRIAITTMPIVDGLHLLDPLALQGRTLTLANYVRLMGGSDYLRARVDRYEGIQKSPTITLATRLFPDGTFTYIIGHNATRFEFEVNELYRKLLQALTYYAEVYRNVNYYGQLRIWFDVVRTEEHKLVANFMSHGFKDLHDLTRLSVLVPIDASTDELNAPIPLVGNIVKYFAQACDYELPDHVISAYEPKS